MNLRFLFLSFAALAGLAAELILQATAQDSLGPATDTTRVVEAREDGTLVERTLDGKTLRTFKKTAQPRIEYEYQEIVETGPDGNVSRRAVQVPVRTPDGSTILLGGVKPADAESQRLLSEEQEAAVDAKTLVASLQRAESVGEDQGELKKKLREKLAEIFDLQQQRRNREIAKIEERLGKLKDTLKKREDAKDSIVDRRLETLTGGVDELGWEDSFGGPANAYGQPHGWSPNTTNVPRLDPAPHSGYPPVAPRTGAGPAYLVPELPERVPTPPAPARAPLAPGASPAPPVAPAPPAPAALPVPAARP